jgi:hypothetical protein
VSLTDLMPSTKDKLIAELQKQLTKANTLLARGVHERDLDEATPGTPLWDARVHLGLDGKTGARDIRADERRACEDPACRNYGTSLHPTPVVLTVDPGVQVEQAAPAPAPNAAGLIELVNRYGKAAYDFGLGDAGASDEMTDIWNEINRYVRRG